MSLLRSILLSFALAPALPAAAPPNIVLIYGDDVGFGDIGSNGATAIATPNLDRIAREGANYTSSYCSSATCTPSRFSMLTGQYAFRQQGTGVLPGDAALIIDTNKPTLQKSLQSAGYRTAVIGKWHLGLGATVDKDWNKPVAPGANETGFHRSFIMAATGDRVPCVYMADGSVVGLDPKDPIEVSYKTPFPGLPNGIDNRNELVMDWTHGHNNAVVNGIGRIGFMKGGTTARWKDDEMAVVFAAQAVNFLRESKDKPFFLFFALHDIHVPRVPHARFRGKTNLGPRGDAMVQADWQVGEVLRTLDDLKLADNTLVIFSSDNGPVLDDGYKDEADSKIGDHRPAGPFRAGKYSLYEGGTRVPTVARWPGRIKPGQTIDALISQVDYPRTFAKLAGATVAPSDFPDSLDLSAALLGESKDGRDHVILHAKRLAIRMNEWKLIPGGDGPPINRHTNTELANHPKDQLFNLANDPGERKNLATDHPEIVAKLREKLESVRQAR